MNDFGIWTRGQAYVFLLSNQQERIEPTKGNSPKHTLPLCHWGGVSPSLSISPVGIRWLFFEVSQGTANKLREKQNLENGVLLNPSWSPHGKLRHLYQELVCSGEYEELGKDGGEEGGGEEGGGGI